jgi:hypothetical protein
MLSPLQIEATISRESHDALMASVVTTRCVYADPLECGMWCDMPEVARASRRVLAIGGINSALTLLLFLLLVISYRAAYGIAFVVGVTFALVPNARLFALPIRLYRKPGVVVIPIEGSRVHTGLAPLGLSRS